MADVYFNVRKLKGKAHKEYVAFVDIMGTRTHMKNSIYESANFIFKLHAAIISAWREKNYHGIFVYPVMDGAYITARNKADMINIMLRIYRELAKLFVKEQTQEHQYMIRGAIAYGEVVHGHDIPYEASKAFENSLGYKDHILLGSAMIAAYDGEGRAAPFGIYVDQSAVKHEEAENKSNYGSFSADWKWYQDSTLNLQEIDFTAFREKIIASLNAMKDTSHRFHYSPDKVQNHIELTQNYFNCV